MVAHGDLDGRATLALACLMAVLATVRWYPAMLLVMFVSGMAWIALMPTFNVAALSALPPWVRARGLSIYNVIFMGGMAVGGIVWGTVATNGGVSRALLAAAAGLVASAPLALLFPLRRSEAHDLSPALHWPTIDGLRPALAPDVGPVMVTVEYRRPHASNRSTRRFSNAGGSRSRSADLRNGVLHPVYPQGGKREDTAPVRTPVLDIHCRLGLKVETLGNVGVYLSNMASGGPTVNTVNFGTGTYRIDNYEAVSKVIVTNTVRVDTYRGYGRPEGAYIAEEAWAISGFSAPAGWASGPSPSGVAGTRSPWPENWARTNTSTPTRALRPKPSRSSEARA